MMRSLRRLCRHGDESQRLVNAGLFAAALLSAFPIESGGQEVQEGRPVVIASKPFAESYLLAEMFAQLLESEGIPVDRRFGFGATEIAFQAIRTGEIDVYPEYTGTGLLAILGETIEGDSDAVFRRVASEFDRQWGAIWLPPLGFENTYAIAVRRETADSLGLATLSDLAQSSPGLVGGFSPDFLGRSDGLPGIEERYSISFRDVRSLLQAVKYEALASRQVDVIDAYSTDGAIDRFEMVVLSDDRAFFPPYDAAALLSGELVSRDPRTPIVLARLSGRLDVALMRELNRRVEVDRESVDEVARMGLTRAGLLPDRVEGETSGGAAPPPGATPGAQASGGDSGGGAGIAAFARYLIDQRGRLFELTIQHLLLVTLSMALAISIALPLGLALERWRGSAEAVIRAVGLLQTIPSIALLAFMIPVLGIGFTPAVVALFLYSLFPILRNSYTGIRDADPVAVSAARAVGMTDGQILREVRLPLAAPVIMAGVRTAGVINVGTATLAAFIGAGGLGDPIVAGLALSNPVMILSGALPAALLAFAVDLGLGGVESRLTPLGLRAD